MKNKLLLLMLTTGLVSSAQDWSVKGIPGFSTGSSSNNKIVIDANGDIVTCYADQTNGGGLSVRKFDGLNWSLIGADGITPPITGAQYSDIAIDNNNVPYVVYRGDASTSFKAGVKKFDGASWVQVGPAGITPSSAQDMDIAIDSNNDPYISFKDQITTKISVMKFDGTNWNIVGVADFSAGQVYGTSLFIDGTNTPYVAYRDAANANGATVMKYDGLNWMVVGSAGFSAGAVSSVDLTVDNTGKPYVVFVDNTVSSKATVMEFNGTIWQIVGTSGISAGQAWNPDITTDQSNVIYISFRDDGVTSKAVCKMFNGLSWQTIGSAGYSIASSDFVSIAIKANGAIYSTFRDVSLSNKATVMEFCGSSSNITVSNCNTYTSPSGLYTWTSSGVYSDTLTNSKGCDSVITITLNITGSDLAAFAYYGLTCLGDTNVVYATMSGTPTFTWNNGLGIGNQHTINPSTTTTYQVIANDGAGCIDTAEVIMPVYPKPNLIITPSDSLICYGDSISVNISGGYSYYMDSPLIDTLETQWFTPPFSGSYYIQAYDSAFNCTVIDSIYIEFDFGPNPGTGFNGTLMWLGSTGFSTQWYYEGTPLIGENGYDYTATQNGNYSVIMTDSLGCTSTASWTVVELSLAEMQALDAVVYPSPFVNEFTISTSTFNQVDIYSLSGELLISRKLSTTQTVMDMTDFPSQVYVVLLSNGENVVIQKVVKQ